MMIIRCKRIAKFLAVVLTIAALAPSRLPALADTSDAASSAAYAADEKVLQLQADKFVQAFAAGDAKGIADLWTPDANFIAAEGYEVHGRDQIQKLYSDYFAANGGQPMEVKIESIHFPSPDVAIEQGVAEILRASDPSNATRYTVVHVKKNGQWLMSDVTETNYLPASSPENLTDLNWLVGDWTAESAKDKVHLNAHWVADKHFILCTFRGEGAEKENFTDAQIIGWDPERKHIFSSTYGAGGGFGRAVWKRDGQNWVSRAWSVQPDGSRATAEYIFSPVDQNSFTWRSCSRSIDGKPIPDTNQIKVVRDIASK